MFNVGGQRAKYGAAKGIVETAQMVYTWITIYQVYAKMKIPKKRDREHEELEHGAPPAIGGAQPENTVDLRGGRPKGNTAAATILLNKRKRKALNDVTLQFNELRQIAHGKGIVVKRGELQRVITTVLE